MRLQTRLVAFMRRYHFPLAALALCLLAYGPLLPTLGVYWDDWMVIFHAQAGRLNALPQLYSFDRPFSAWTALMTVPLLGSQPLAWHLFALLLRWLLALALAWSLGLVWPRARTAVRWAALLFAVYPAYLQQPIAVAFSQHLLAYGLFFVSLGAMLVALRKPAQRWQWTALALASQALHLITVEHFAGLELLRPFLIFAALADEGKEIGRRTREALLRWLPYLLLLALVSLWRLVWLDLPVEPHPPELLIALRANPLPALVGLAEEALQSLAHVLFDVWSATLRPALFTLDDRAALLGWAVGALAAGALYWWGARRSAEEVEAQDGPRTWIGLGPLAVLLGLLPIWIIGEQILQRGYHEHLVLPAILGAALFWAGLIYTLVARPRQRILLFTVLIGLAVAAQLRSANELRNDWQSQQKLYQQLQLRAPGIQPGTALVSFERLTPYTQNSSLAAAINTLYPQSRPAPHLDYWNFEMSFSDTVDTLEGGEAFETHYRGLQFAAEDADSVLLYFMPQSGCLWLLSQLDIHNRYLPAETRALAARSNLERINSQALDPDYSADHIFGEADADSWCGYYQRAELARQFAEWEAVMALYEEALAAGRNPDNGLELLGLIDAYAHLGRWADALQTSREVARRHQLNQPMLCALWAEFEAQGLAVPAQAQADINQIANCAGD